MINQRVQISGLTCSACAKLTQMRLRHLPGVTAVAVEVSGEANIISEREVTAEEINQALESTPYRAV